MERKLDFKALVKKTQWTIVKQFCLSVIVAYIFPLSTISIDIHSETHSIASGLSVNTSSKLTILEFIETNKHIELMQQRIKNMIQIEKDQKEDILFKVSAMAHDLKTPLTVIRGNSELLQFAPLSGIDFQCLRDIERASNQLETILIS